MDIWVSCVVDAGKGDGYITGLRGRKTNSRLRSKENCEEERYQDSG